MALTDKLTAIGNAIRGKTGGSSLLSLDDMATAITGITVGGNEEGYLSYKTIQISNRTGYTGQLQMTIPSEVNTDVNKPGEAYKNWILFFPILTAASTYGLGVCVSDNQAFGMSLYSNTTGSTPETSYVQHRKTAQIIMPTGTDIVGNVQNGYVLPFLEVMSNVNVHNISNTSVILANTSTSTYPRAVTGKGLLIYWKSTTLS